MNLIDFLVKTQLARYNQLVDGIAHIYPVLGSNPGRATQSGQWGCMVWPPACHAGDQIGSIPILTAQFFGQVAQ